MTPAEALRPPERRDRRRRAEHARRAAGLQLRSHRVRAHPRRQRAAVLDGDGAQASERAAARPARAARDQHHRRERQDLRAAARQGVPSAQLADADDRGLPRRHRGARARQARCGAACERDDARDRRPDRAARRARRGLCERRRRRVLQRRGLPALRRALGPAARRADRRLARRAGRGQALAARLRALEGQQARTRTPPGTRPGAAGGPAGTSSARRWRARSSARTSTCTAAGSI